MIRNGALIEESKQRLNGIKKTCEELGKKRMTAEQSYFIRVLSDFLSQKKTEPPEGLDWKELFRLSRSHKVEGVLFKQCKDFMPEKDKDRGQLAYESTVYLYANLKYEFQKIQNVLKSNDIFFFPVKGFYISSYYPIKELRTMSDCDFIVHHSDMARIQNLMRDQGYNGINNIHARSWDCRKKSFMFEFHDQLVTADECITEAQYKFFSEFDSYVFNHQLENNFHFIFLLMHLRKHFMNSGVGIRQFMDLAVLVKNETGLDWDWIEKKLLEIQLMPFAKACLSLIRKWFNIAAPIGITDMDDGSFEQITEKILGNGVFGKDDPENAGNFEKNVLIRTKGSMLFRRISMICKILFPSYQFMSSYPRCEFLFGRPVLLPCAWIKRILMLFQRGGFGKIKRIVHNSLVSVKTIKKQEALLKKMGLS